MRWSLGWPRSNISHGIPNSRKSSGAPWCYRRYYAHPQMRGRGQNSCDFSALGRPQGAWQGRRARGPRCRGPAPYRTRVAPAGRVGPADRTLRPAWAEPPEGRNSRGVTRSMDTETRSTSAERVRAHRKLRKYGHFLRTITVTKGELDQLEERGYLASNDRGDRTAECEAIETFIMDSLLKP
jgi:hypothetical protein